MTASAVGSSMGLPPAVMMVLGTLARGCASRVTTAIANFSRFSRTLDHDRALLVVVVQHLAVQALDALVGVDVPLGMDRLHRAFVAAALAGLPHSRIAPQPVEQPERAGIAIAAPSGHR